MHTVEQGNVINKNDNKLSDESLTYTDHLNSAIDSTKRKRTRNKTNRFIYSVGDFNFLFEQNLKVENLAKTTISKVPHAPAWCVGIVNVRGNIIPIVDMHVILKSELGEVGAKSKKTLLLMMEHENHVPIILQINKLPEIVDINDYTSGEAKKSPNWVKCNWENSTNKLYEVNHDELFTLIKTKNI